MGHSTRVTGFIRFDDGSMLPALEPPEACDFAESDLSDLLAALAKRESSPRCAGLIRNMATTMPLHRLGANLRSTMIAMVKNRGEPNGLTVDEEAVLREIDAAFLDDRLRKTAYALFDLEARRTFMSAFGDVFNKAKTQKGRHLENHAKET